MNKIAVSEARSPKRIVFNFVCGIAEHLTSASTALLLTPFLIKKLGLELYGIYPIATELAAVFAVLFGIINSTSSRYVAIEAERGNASSASGYISTVFFSNIAFSALLITPMAVLTVFSDRLLSIPERAAQDVKTFLFLMFLSVITDAVASAFGSVYYVTNRLDARSGQRLISVFVKASVLILLLKFAIPSITSVGIAVFSSSLTALIIQVLTLKSLAPSLRLSSSLFSFSKLKRLSASGLWYSLNRIASVMMGGVFLILSNILFSAETSGIYSIAFVFANSLSGVILTLAAVFVPISAKCFARGERKRLRDSLIRDERVVGYFASVAVPVGCVFCSDFFALWLGSKPDPLLITLSALLVTPILSLACATPIINVAMVMNRTRRLSLLFLGSGIFSLAVGLFVSYFSSLGAVGLASVSCAAQIVWYSLAVPVFAGRVFECSSRHFLFPILRTYFAAVLATICCLLLRSVCKVESPIQLIITGGAALTISALVAFFGVYRDFTPQNR